VELDVPAEGADVVVVPEQPQGPLEDRAHDEQRSEKDQEIGEAAHGGRDSSERAANARQS
jgi:hypothetical protein